MKNNKFYDGRKSTHFDFHLSSLIGLEMVQLFDLEYKYARFWHLLSK